MEGRRRVWEDVGRGREGIGGLLRKEGKQPPRIHNPSLFIHNTS